MIWPLSIGPLAQRRRVGWGVGRVHGVCAPAQASLHCARARRRERGPDVQLRSVRGLNRRFTHAFFLAVGGNDPVVCCVRILGLGRACLPVSISCPCPYHASAPIPPHPISSRTVTLMSLRTPAHVTLQCHIPHFHIRSYASLPSLPSPSLRCERERAFCVVSHPSLPTSPSSIPPPHGRSSDHDER